MANNKKIMPIIGGALIFALLIVLVIFFTGKENGNVEEQPQSPLREKERDKDIERAQIQLDALDKERQNVTERLSSEEDLTLKEKEAAQKEQINAIESARQDFQESLSSPTHSSSTEKQLQDLDALRNLAN